MADTIRGSAWIRESLRWAIYLRDSLQCQYCLTTAQEILQGSDDNFLTLDHFQHRSNGGHHGVENLVTACFRCNQSRGEKSLRAWCTERGWRYDTVRSRVYMTRRQSIAPYREAAKVLIGRVEGIPRADLVTLMAYRARRQWAGWQEKLEWAKDIETCDKCKRRIGDTGPPPPVESDEEVPF